MNSKKFQWLNNFKLLFLSPFELGGALKEQRKSYFLTGLFVWLSAIFAEILMSSFLSAQSSFFYYKITFGFLLIALIMFFCLIFYAVLIELLAKLKTFNLDGDIRDLLTALMLAHYPLMFMLPILLLLKSFNIGIGVFYFIFNLLALIWGLYVAAQILTGLYQNKNSKNAVLLLILPTFILTLVGYLCFGLGFGILQGLI